jgi:hypothetical protein
MTYSQAKMIVWNPETYSKDDVRKAAVYILGTLEAEQEDIDQASMVISTYR